MLQNDKYLNCVVTIFAVYVAYLTLMGVLQVAGVGVGFQILPSGEDLNWLYLLNAGSLVDIFKAFWSLDHRNPAAALWWILASPIIHFSDWGLHAISLVVYPLAAVVTFSTLDRLARREAKLFSLLTALLVLFWSLSSRSDHVDRVMIIALIFTLLAINAYVKFVDGGRNDWRQFALALLFYLIALATYTIQCGAIIAVPLVCFFRLEASGRKRLLCALIDGALFLAILLAYTIIWMYYLGPISSSFSLSIGDALVKSITSIQLFLFPPYNDDLLALALAEFPQPTMFILIAISLALAVTILVFAIRAATPSVEKVPALWALVLLMAIGVPTVLIEASSPIWGPGSRSIMVMQVWQPLFLMTLVAIVGGQLLRRYLLTVGFLVFATVAIFVGLGMNHAMTLTSKYDRNLAALLRELNEGQADRMSYLVIVKNPVVGYKGGDQGMPAYSPMILDKNKASSRLLVKYPPPTNSSSELSKTKFTDEGVENARLLYDKTVTPYADVNIVYFNGESIDVPKIINKEDLDGYHVEWLKTQPIRQ